MKEWMENTEISWLKLISALLLIFVSMYLPSLPSSPSGGVSAISALLSAFGGALLADAFVTPKRFIKSVSPRLNSINRLLATIASQISSIIIEEKKKSAENHSINRLSELIPTLRAIITDLSDITGDKFDPNTLNETIDSIGSLITALEHSDHKESSENVITELKSIYSNLQNKNILLRTSVNCPYDGCDGQEEIQLGATPPASNVVTCSKCKEKYHAHRTHDGAVQTKKWGGKTSS